MPRQYKYKTTFSNEIRASSSNIEDDKINISKASLDSLSNLVPEDINFDANIDLLAVAFNAAVANKFNKNHDGIDTETALAVADYFVHKPTNIEHKKQKVVGHVVSSGFSDFATNKILSKEELKETTSPFNISLAAVIYKTVNREFANLVEKSSNPKNDSHNLVSASWEIGFNDFVLALGSKNLEEAEIISEEKQIEEMSKYLKAFEGEGKLEDGTEIYRLVCGDVYPLGIGFTANPAADVKGVFVQEDKKKEESSTPSSQQKAERIEVNNSVFLKKIKNYKKNPSRIEKTNVISDKAQKYPNYKTMEIKELIEEIKETIQASSSEKFSNESVANVARVVSDAIRERSEEFAKEKAEIQQQKEEVVKAHEEAQEKLQQIEEELASSREKIGSLEAEQNAAKALQVFNDRMDSIDESYELSDEDRKIIAEDLKKVEESEEAFASYQERVKVLFSHKSKNFLAEQEKQFNERVEAEISKKLNQPKEEVQASEEKVSEEEVEEILEDVEASEEVSTNNGETIEKEISLAEKFQNAFNKESITIKY